MTERGAELDRGGADAARAAVDQRRLARREACGIEEIGPHGEERLGQRRRVEKVHAARHRQHATLRSGAEFRIAATGDERANLVADFEFADISCAFDYFARNFHSENRRGAFRRRVKPFRLQEIGAVQARARDLDQHLASLEHGLWCFGDDEPVIRPRIFNLNRAHHLLLTV
jgi:hypothetical protein